MVVQLPSCPASLRCIQPYLKTAIEHDERDPIVSYWCRLYALQTALTIDKKSDEAKSFLLPLMEWLEKTKRSSSANESITSDTAAQAYIENYALKLFIWADNMDRAGTFNKNVVKSFYTSGMLMDVLSVFGELTEEISKNRKYAKWKAAYIHNCLKNGETPVPGPQDENDQENEFHDLLNLNIKQEIPNTTPHSNVPDNLYEVSPNSSNVPSGLNVPESSSVLYNPYPTSSSGSGSPPKTLNITDNIFTSNQTAGIIKLDASQIAKAQKFCKFASSALNYDDIPEAVSNLQKALKLLQTGGDE